MRVVLAAAALIGLGVGVRGDVESLNGELTQMLQRLGVEEFESEVVKEKKESQDMGLLEQFLNRWRTIDPKERDSIKKYNIGVMALLGKEEEFEGFRAAMRRIFQEERLGNEKTVPQEEVCRWIDGLAASVWEYAENVCAVEEVESSEKCDAEIDAIRSSVELLVAASALGSENVLAKVEQGARFGAGNWEGMFSERNVCEKVETVRAFLGNSQVRLFSVNVGRFTQVEAVLLASQFGMDEATVGRIRRILLEHGTTTQIGKVLADPKIYWNDELRTAILQSSGIELETAWAKNVVRLMDQLGEQEGGLKNVVSIFRAGPGLTRLIEGKCADKILFLKQQFVDETFVRDHVGLLADEKGKPCSVWEMDREAQLKRSSKKVTFDPSKDTTKADKWWPLHQLINNEVARAEIDPNTPVMAESVGPANPNPHYDPLLVESLAAEPDDTNHDIASDDSSSSFLVGTMTTQDEARVVADNLRNDSPTLVDKDGPGDTLSADSVESVKTDDDDDFTPIVDLELLNRLSQDEMFLVLDGLEQPNDMYLLGRDALAQALLSRSAETGFYPALREAIRYRDPKMNLGKVLRILESARKPATDWVDVTREMIAARTFVRGFVETDDKDVLVGLGIAVARAGGPRVDDHILTSLVYPSVSFERRRHMLMSVKMLGTLADVLQRVCGDSNCADLTPGEFRDSAVDGSTASGGEIDNEVGAAEPPPVGAEVVESVIRASERTDTLSTDFQKALPLLSQREMLQLLDWFRKQYPSGFPDVVYMFSRGDMIRLLSKYGDDMSIAFRPAIGDIIATVLEREILFDSWTQLSAEDVAVRSRVGTATDAQLKEIAAAIKNTFGNGDDDPNSRWFTGVFGNVIGSQYIGLVRQTVMDPLVISRARRVISGILVAAPEKQPTDYLITKLTQREIYEILDWFGESRYTIAVPPAIYTWPKDQVLGYLAQLENGIDKIVKKVLGNPADVGAMLEARKIAETEWVVLNAVQVGMRNRLKHFSTAALERIAHAVMKKSQGRDSVIKGLTGALKSADEKVPHWRLLRLLKAPKIFTNHVVLDAVGAEERSLRAQTVSVLKQWEMWRLADRLGIEDPASKSRAELGEELLRFGEGLDGAMRAELGVIDMEKRIETPSAWMSGLSAIRKDLASKSSDEIAGIAETVAGEKGEIAEYVRKGKQLSDENLEKDPERESLRKRLSTPQVLRMLATRKSN